jgi:hypothetical protein
MNDLILLESVSARNEKLTALTQDAALDHLNKAKSLIMAMWQGSGIATTQQLADYYDVSIDTVRSVLSRHKDEFDSDGLREIKGKDLKALQSQGSDTMQLPEKTTRLTVWTPRAALRLGMLLRDSDVAKQVRSLLLDIATQAPAQSDRIRELELQLELTKAQTNQVQLVNSMATLHGLPTTLCLLGRSEAIVEVEKPTIEIIDDRNSQRTRYKGQTCTQLKEYMKERFGITFKSGADIKRILEKIESKTGESLLGVAPRQIATDYIPEEFSEKAIAYLRNAENRQMLLGE